MRLNRESVARAAPAIAQWVFVVAAVALVVAAVASVVSRQHFLAGAERTTGTVVALAEQYGGDATRGGGVVFVPVVAFRDADGRPHRFASRTGTNPPGQRVGDVVDVLYQRDDPVDAELASFSALWLWPLVSGALALAMLGGAAICRLFRPRSRRERERLRRDGRRVLGRSPRVVVDYTQIVNGAHPWRVEVDVDDPLSGGLRTVRSDSLWAPPRDPQPDPLTVFIDPKRPRRCLVEVAAQEGAPRD